VKTKKTISIPMNYILHESNKTRLKEAPEKGDIIFGNNLDI
jgi:hypothetical protein